MTEFDSFMHFVRKKHEVYHLYFRHYLPQGKPLPEYYRDVIFEDFKLWESGKLPELTKEPMMDEYAKQLGLFEPLPKRQINSIITSSGTPFDKDKEKKSIGKKP